MVYIPSRDEAMMHRFAALSCYIQLQYDMKSCAKCPCGSNIIVGIEHMCFSSLSILSQFPKARSRILTIEGHPDNLPRAFTVSKLEKFRICAFDCALCIHRTEQANSKLKM